MPEANEFQTVEQVKDDLGEVIKSQFGKGFQSVTCFVFEEDTEAIKGIFQGNRTFWNFSISSNEVLSYSKLGLNFRMDSNDAFWQGVRMVRRGRYDGVQIKKNCKPGVSVPCGESCIPIGAICHEGLPSSQQVKTRAVRALLKASRKVAKAAAVVALGVGMTALAAYAAKKAQDGNLGEKVRRTAEGVGMKRETVESIQSFTSQVAEASLPKPIGEAIRAGREKAAAAKAEAKIPKTLLGKMSQNVQIEARKYVEKWKRAPVQTAMAHASVGLLLYGTGRAAENLGYIPEGSVERAVGAEAMRERMSERTRTRTEPSRVTSRTTSWGG